MRVKLVRLNSSKFGVQGVILGVNNEVVVATQERPWLDNQASVSCIPEGVYQMQDYSSARYDGVVQLMDVPSRTYILIHVGNFIKDSEGCILVGDHHTGTSEVRDMVSNSKAAHKRMMEYFHSKVITEVEVVNAYESR